MVYSSKQRRDRVLECLYRQGHVLVKDLAGLLQISEATVRRDLKAMADQQDIELVYGGATLRRGSDFSFRSKRQRNIEAKRVVGELAAARIQDGDQIFMDSGTTTFEMAPMLKHRRQVSVIANSTRLAEELAVAAELTVIMLGGQYRADRMDTVGPLAMSALEQLRGYRAFIGADGVSMDFGLTASDIESAHLYRLAVRQARETFLLVDHSKFLAPSLYKIVEWDGISCVITDRRPAPEWEEFLKQRNIELVAPESAVLAEAGGEDDIKKGQEDA